jgi:hypothetical protein
VLKGGKYFVLKLRAAEEGEHTLRVSADIKKDNMPWIRDYSVTRKVMITRNEIEIESNMEEGSKFNSGQTQYFTLYLTNPNTYTNFTDLNVSYNIPWYGNKTINVKTLKEVNYYDILNANMKMPTVSSATILRYYVNVSYNTGMGERLNKTFVRSITVSPPPDIQIVHEIGPKIIQDSGYAEIDQDETEIILRIRNLLEKDLESVMVTESFDTRLNKAGEISNKLVLLKKADITEIYRYKITPPVLNKFQNFTLRTHVSYIFEGKAFNNSFDVDLKIKPKAMDIEVTKSKIETETSKGQLMHIQYRIKNTEKEPIKNVIVHFPLQYDTDNVGSRTFSIRQILPEETVLVNEDIMRAKSSGSLLIKETNVTFDDAYGNSFSEYSNAISAEVLKSYVETPLIFAEKKTHENLTSGDEFEVNLTVRNDGAKKTWVEINDSGYAASFISQPGSAASFTYNSTTYDSGYIALPPAVISYKDGETQYYTASSSPYAYSKKKKETIAPQITKQTQEEAPPMIEKKSINTKYIYLALLIIVACLIIWYILKRKPKEEFNFIGE